jgi:hypothetical protein
MGPITHGDAVARQSFHRRRGHAWPFKAALPEPTTVSDCGVGVPRRQEVEFADGTRIWLHRVEQQGVPDLFVRELGAPAAGTRVDLRTLAPELAKDLPTASTRDVPGVVHYSLRGQFRSVKDLVQAAVATGRPA